MDAKDVEIRKQEFLRWERSLDAKERLVFRCAVGLEVVMVLLPPKVASVSMMGMTQSNSIGYSFIFENPTAGGFMLGGVEVHVSWLRLLVQMIVVAGAAYFLIKYFKEQRVGTAPFPPSNPDAHEERSAPPLDV